MILIASIRILAIAALLCSTSAAGGTTGDRPNILVVILDDVGVDKVGAYAEHPDAPPTPNIDKLSERGVLFRRAWTHPTCSPARAGLFTGRYAFRHGVGSAINYFDESYALSTDETTLADVLPYRNAMLGKWHLGSKAATTQHPLECGFDIVAGSPSQVDSIPQFVPIGAVPPSYVKWTKNVNGELSVVTTYATTDTANDTVAAISGALLEPWFVVSSYNAAHTPTHAPPDDLYTQPLPTTISEEVDAMVEALDTELGRVFEVVDFEDTVVILLGDNGTIEKATTSPFDPEHAKLTPYEGGVRVPLIIAGATVNRGECRGLVQVQDLFPTICRLGGVVPPPNDGVSLQPYLRNPARPSIREWVYTEGFVPNGVPPATVNEWDRTVRDTRYKLIRRSPGDVEEFYDLFADPFEATDLLTIGLSSDEAERFDALSEVLDELEAEANGGSR